jgi:hypothetical protein
MSRPGKTASIVRLSLLLLPLFAPNPAGAALMRIDFSGTIGIMTASGPGVADQKFTGTLFYDDAAPLTSVIPTPANNWTTTRYESGTQRSTNPVADGTGLDIRIAGQSVAPPSTGLQGGISILWNGSVPRGLTFGFSSHPNNPAGYSQGVGVTFETTNLDLFRDGKLPADLKLSDLSGAHIGISNAMNGKFLDGSFNYSGTIESLTITPVPEPAWTVAALMGAVCWTVRRRRKAA